MSGQHMGDEMFRNPANLGSQTTCEGKKGSCEAMWKNVSIGLIKTPPFEVHAKAYSETRDYWPCGCLDKGSATQLGYDVVRHFSHLQGIARFGNIVFISSTVALCGMLNGINNGSSGGGSISAGMRSLHRRYQCRRSL